MATEDKYLIIKLKGGDKDAFKQLFEKYYPLFLSFVHRMLKDPSIAEDLGQNVFMRVWVGRGRLDENKNFKNYLLVSVRNEIYQYFRHAFKTEDDSLSAEIADTGINIETEVSAKELEKNIALVVSDMPQRRREVFNMSRHEKLSNTEIAQRLGLSVRTVEKHIENALADIRKHLPASVLLIIMTLF